MPADFFDPFKGEGNWTAPPRARLLVRTLGELLTQSRARDLDPARRTLRHHGAASRVTRQRRWSGPGRARWALPRCSTAPRPHSRPARQWRTSWGAWPETSSGRRGAAPGLSGQADPRNVERSRSAPLPLAPVTHRVMPLTTIDPQPSAACSAALPAESPSSPCATASTTTTEIDPGQRVLLAQPRAASRADCAGQERVTARRHNQWRDRPINPPSTSSKSQQEELPGDLRGLAPESLRRRRLHRAAPPARPHHSRLPRQSFHARRRSSIRPAITRSATAVAIASATSAKENCCSTIAVRPVNWPTWWLSEMQVTRPPVPPAIRFRHIGGITKGWTWSGGSSRATEERRWNWCTHGTARAGR